MSELLSQAEIDALLKKEAYPLPKKEQFSSEEIDVIGEVGNISMGTAATALYTIINRKVTITTPKVSVTSLREISKQYNMPFVAVEVFYTDGIKGANLLVITEQDVKIITDLMMGGDGTNTDAYITDLHLSAIGEAMNQMIGSSCTSLASMLQKSINISPPRVFVINFEEDMKYDFFGMDEPIVKIKFKMEVHGLINSFIMQLVPIEFAKELVDTLLKEQESLPVASHTLPPQKAAANLYAYEQESEWKAPLSQVAPKPKNTKQIDVRPVAFQEFEDKSVLSTGKENLDLILDVPLQISVELGKARKLIREILELNSGAIIELDKMAGEPVDILVNGKMIAKGEVVVIENSFGVRITDILSPEKRVLKLK